MSKIAPLQKKQTNNSLYRDKNISFKCMVFFYKFIHVFFGLDFGFIEIKGLKILTFLQCLFVSTLTILSLTTVYGRQDFVFWYSIPIIQYFLYVLFLLRIKKETTFYNLIQDLRTIDLGLKVIHSSFFLEIKLLIFLLGCFVYRVWMLFSFYFFLNEHEVADLDEDPISTLLHASVRFTILTVELTIDTVRVTYAFMFFAINCRLKELRLLLKTKQFGFLSMQYIYRSIVDITEQHKEAFDPVMIASLMFNVPQAMTLMLNIVQRSRSLGHLALSPGVIYIIISEMLLLTVLPAISAGLLTSQAKQMKLVLHDLLMTQQEYGQQLREIERFIRYVEVRGCRFHVLKLIPLDASLLGMVISFCVTYLIVIIQFTYSSGQ